MKVENNGQKLLKQVHLEKMIKVDTQLVNVIKKCENILILKMTKKGIKT